MQKGGSPFGAPPPLHTPAEMTPFRVVPESAPPISAHPLPTGVAAAPNSANYEELAAADDLLGVAGDDGGGGLSGNRWPRPETLALIKIRSEMDSAFKDSTLKGPLWEEVSRKLGELGYKRSAKKCKEKFENVHKYYKRTKEGRAGRQDGKSYRFFDQLEALYNITITTPSSAAVAAAPSIMSNASGSHNPQQPQPPMQISAPIPITTVPPTAAAGFSFSSKSSSSSGSETDEYETTEKGRKRKRKMMEFFEGMMRQVMERQEAMQQRFLEAIEKRDQERTAREDAWWRQEQSRLAHETELAAQERAAAASRDAMIISFLKNLTGDSTPVQTPPPQKQYQQKQKQNQHPQQQLPQPQPQPPPPPPITISTELVAQSDVATPGLDATSSRWPKSEVHALIQLRSGLDSRYQENGPKGPLWEEISSRMRKLGYNRSSKRCKEKWENINKYFKKVKEGNKKRPDDAKTCPYFHQLDALYRNKVHNSNPNLNPSPINMIAPSQQGEMESDNGGNVEVGAGGSGNGRTGSGLFIGGGERGGRGDNSGMIMKKPEDIVKELVERSNNDYSEPENDNMDEDDEFDEDEDDEDGKGQYRIQFSNNGDGSGNGSAVPSNGGEASESVLAMVR